MSGKRENTLIVIENGRLVSYRLDDHTAWKVGRVSKNNIPNIKLHSTTVSRKHGKFQNMGGIWFYIDRYGTNGTTYNGSRITAGLGGRTWPIMLEDGDVLIFGGGEKGVINSKTVWAMFLKRSYSEGWHREDTRGLKRLRFTDGKDTTTYQEPVKGMVVKKENGIAVYMGDLTYLTGDMKVSGEASEVTGEASEVTGRTPE